MSHCIRGHDRDVTGNYANGACKLCADFLHRKWVAGNPERKREIGRRWKAANPESVRAWTAANASTIKAQAKVRYEKNRAEVIARSIQWKKDNPEKSFAAYRRWYVANQAAQIEKYRRWRKDNPDTSRERTNKYRRTHRETSNAIAKIWNQRRRALKQNTVSTLTSAEWQTILLAHEGRCAHCGTTERITMDHIVPLSRGGTHTKENIQPLCKPCNSRKKNRLESDLRKVAA